MWTVLDYAGATSKKAGKGASIQWVRDAYRYNEVRRAHGGWGGYATGERNARALMLQCGVWISYVRVGDPCNAMSKRVVEFVRTREGAVANQSDGLGVRAV